MLILVPPAYIVDFVDAELGDRRRVEGGVCLFVRTCGSVKRVNKRNKTDGKGTAKGEKGTEKGEKGKGEGRKTHLRPRSAFCTSTISQRTVFPANGPESK